MIRSPFGGIDGQKVELFGSGFCYGFEISKTLISLFNINILPKTKQKLPFQSSH